MSSNNSHDLFEEIKLTAIWDTLDPMAVTPWTLRWPRTSRWSEGLGHKASSDKPGTILDFYRPHLIPCRDVVENLVFAARGSDVVMNMAGRSHI